MKDFKTDIKDYLIREKAALDKINIDELNDVLNCMLKHYENEDTIYVMGNGGSASTASHMVCDFNKGVSLNLPKKFNLVCLNDNLAELMAIANDMSYEDVFWYPLQTKLKPTDCVLAISGSGNSKNVIKAVEYAKEIGCDIIGVTGYDGGKLKKIANYHLDAGVNDMQISEDLHLIFNHLMMQILWKHLMNENGQEAIYKINK